MKKTNFNEYPAYLKTDILPFEVPILLSNDEYYNYIIKNRNKYEKFCRNYIECSDEYIVSSIPLSFTTYVREDRERNISLINPHSYLSILKFIQIYENTYLGKFNDSIISLRYPYIKQSKYMYTSGKSLNLYYFDNIDKVEKKNGSFYNIWKYKRSYEFENSKYFLDLQYRYNHFLKIDIKACFDSIYTHSYKWIVSSDFQESKEIANSYSMYAVIDKLLQNINGKKTNGVLVGPEFSRLCAEILLNEIDNEILFNINEFNFKNDESKIEFKIKRFIDDYYIFSNSRYGVEKIEKIIKDKLKFYMLQTNDKKRLYKDDYFILNEWFTQLNDIILNIDFSKMNKISTQKKIMHVISTNKEQRSTVVSYLISVIVGIKQNEISLFKNILVNKNEKLYLSDKKIKKFLTLFEINIDEAISCLDECKKYKSRYGSINIKYNGEHYIVKEEIKEIANEKFEKSIFSSLSLALFYIQFAPKYVNFLKITHLINDFIIVSEYIGKYELKNSIINAIYKSFDFELLEKHVIETSNLYIIFEYLNIEIEVKIIRNIISYNNNLFNAFIYRYARNFDVYKKETNDIKKIVLADIESLCKIVNEKNVDIFMKSSIWSYLLFYNSKDFKDLEVFNDFRCSLEEKLTQLDRGNNKKYNTSNLINILNYKYYINGNGFFDHTEELDLKKLEIINKNIYFKSLINISY